MLMFVKCHASATVSAHKYLVPSSPLHPGSLPIQGTTVSPVMDWPFCCSFLCPDLSWAFLKRWHSSVKIIVYLPEGQNLFLLSQIWECSLPSFLFLFAVLRPSVPPAVPSAAFQPGRRTQTHCSPLISLGSSLSGERWTDCAFSSVTRSLLTVPSLCDC